MKSWGHPGVGRCWGGGSPSRDPESRQHQLTDGLHPQGPRVLKSTSSATAKGDRVSQGDRVTQRYPIPLFFDKRLRLSWALLLMHRKTNISVSSSFCDVPSLPKPSTVRAQEGLQSRVCEGGEAGGIKGLQQDPVAGRGALPGEGNRTYNLCSVPLGRSQAFLQAPAETLFLFQKVYA